MNSPQDQTTEYNEMSLKWKLVGTIRCLMLIGVTALVLEMGFLSRRRYNYIGYQDGGISVGVVNTSQTSSDVMRLYVGDPLPKYSASTDSRLNASSHGDGSKVVVDVWQKQKLRQEQAQQTCEAKPYHKQALHPSAFGAGLVNSKHHVMFCVVGKVASTSFTTLMLEKVGQYNTPLTEHGRLIKSGKTPLTYITRYNTKEGQRITSSYFSIVYGRNPWVRLLSAFNDKFENKRDRQYYHQLYGRDIIRRFRPGANKRVIEKGNDVRFPEFIAWVVDTIKRKKNLDAHWTSVESVCHMCQMQYSFLGQLEEVEEESPLLLKLAFNVTMETHAPQVHRKRKADTKQQIADAYRDIPHGHIEVLRNYYKTDFEVFGYSKDIPGLANVSVS